MPATRALRAALAEPWAITAEGLELVLSVAARENDVSIEALEAYRAEHVPTAERLTRRGAVAILDVRGPLVSRANLLRPYPARPPTTSCGVIFKRRSTTRRSARLSCLTTRPADR
ncbi:hypothetical protein HGG76_15190 [Ochrobactrum tritici]|uniref:Uncharacterized protein n=1 Tax=Brucella tritici TaxID=94626 RepID=A0A7X6FR28_9HYPH|nr:hypothetical protein [Brucella tritici]